MGHGFCRGFGFGGDVFEVFDQKLYAVAQFDNRFGRISVKSRNQFGKFVDIAADFILNFRGLLGCQLGHLLKLDHLGTNGIGHGLCCLGSTLFGVNKLVHIGPEEFGLLLKRCAAVNIGHNHPDNGQRKRNSGKESAKFVGHHQKEV